jgi:hypothetical protein
MTAPSYGLVGMEWLTAHQFDPVDTAYYQPWMAFGDFSTPLFLAANTESFGVLMQLNRTGSVQYFAKFVTPPQIPPALTVSGLISPIIGIILLPVFRLFVPTAQPHNRSRLAVIYLYVRMCRLRW